MQALRTKRGWSQAQLGARAGVAQTAISLIERGERAASPAHAVRLAAALGVSIGDLT